MGFFKNCFSGHQGLLSFPTPGLFLHHLLLRHQPSYNTCWFSGEIDILGLTPFSSQPHVDKCYFQINSLSEQNVWDFFYFLFLCTFATPAASWYMLMTFSYFLLSSYSWKMFSLPLLLLWTILLPEGFCNLKGVVELLMLIQNTRTAIVTLQDYFESFTTESIYTVVLHTQNKSKLKYTFFYYM